jgi:hypothetical protein
MPPQLIWQLTGRGFGSEILLMLMGRLYAILNHYDFALASRYSNIAWRRGWSDYFEPFCEEVDHPLAFEGSVTLTLSSPPRRWLRALAARVLGLIRGRRTLFSFEVWPAVWNASFASGTFALPGQDSVLDAYSALRILLKEVWRPKETTRQAVTDRLAKFNLGDAPFAGIHIRRGDKWQEAPPLTADTYARAVESIDPTIKRCFVASDSYAAVQELAAARPHWTIASFVAPDDAGHHQGAFNRYPPDARRDRVLDLLAEIEALSKAAFFVGTYSSNIGVLLALLRGKDSCHGVDGPLRIYRPY